jgi:2-(1,2-epoxy-1,2-dihydrophenyl)acetyl-CoA isomerase
MSDFKTLLLEARSGVALLGLNRPWARNAIDETLRAELPLAMAQVRDDASVRAVVLYGVGGNFCSGGDLRAMSAKPRTAFESRQRIRALHAWLPEWVNLEKPLIAAVDGAAFGGGFSLALTADFVLASPRASFCQVFARIGLVPDMAALYLLPRIVGLQRAKELAMSGRVLFAPEAQQMGIVHSLYAPDELLDAAISFAKRFTHASPIAMGLTKSILNQSMHLDQKALSEMECFAQGLCMDSAYHQESVRGFLSGQPPAFVWPADSEAKPTAKQSGDIT